eukprot:EG_transcript_27210
MSRVHRFGAVHARMRMCKFRVWHWSLYILRCVFLRGVGATWSVPPVNDPQLPGPLPPTPPTSTAWPKPAGLCVVVNCHGNHGKVCAVRSTKGLPPVNPTRPSRCLWLTDAATAITAARWNSRPLFVK